MIPLRHRHRDNTVDEDGPPATFVADLINDVHKDLHKTRQQVADLFLTSYLSTDFLVFYRLYRRLPAHPSRVQISRTHQHFQAKFSR